MGNERHELTDDHWGKQTTRCWGPIECMQHGTVPEISPVTQTGNWTMPRRWIDIKSHRPFSLLETINFSMLTRYRPNLAFGDPLDGVSNLKISDRLLHIRVHRGILPTVSNIFFSAKVSDLSSHSRSSETPRTKAAIGPSKLNSASIAPARFRHNTVA